MNLLEAKALLAVVLIRERQTDGSFAARCSRVLDCVFKRASEGRKVLEALARQGLISCDWAADKIHANDSRVVQAVGLGVGEMPAQGRLFQPSALNGALSDVCGSSGGGGAPPTQSACGAHAQPNVNVSETFNRSNVETNKRLTLSGAAAAAQREAVAELRARVREFVGEEDFLRCWTKASYIWGCAEYRRVLEQELNGIVAGLEDGSLQVKHSRGKMLWSYTRATWQREQSKDDD